jgi:hypothetical protein
MANKIENIINSCERKILRRILGHINDNGTWRIRYNNEIYTLRYGRVHVTGVSAAYTFKLKKTFSE